MTAYQQITRYNNIPDMPPHVERLPIIGQWHLDDDKADGEHDYQTVYEEYRPLSVRLDILRERSRELGQVILNAELGRLSLARCRGEVRTASGLAHVGRIVYDLGMVGTEVVAVYNEAIWAEPMTAAETHIHWDLIGQPRMMLKKIRWTGDLPRMTTHIGRWVDYCATVGCEHLLHVAPAENRSDWEWERTLDMMGTLRRAYNAHTLVYADSGAHGRDMPDSLRRRVEQYHEATTGNAGHAVTDPI